MPEFKSLQLERHVLGGLLRYNGVFSEIDPFVGENDFTDKDGRSIYCVIRSVLQRGEKLDRVMLAEKLRSLGITSVGAIPIFDYIDGISCTQITEKGTYQACQELVKQRILRDLAANSAEVLAYLNENQTLPINQIIDGVDKIHHSKINILKTDDAPVNIFKGIEELVEERGNNPVEESGHKSPFPEFNRLYGGYRNGNVYAYVSRPGQGKSTMLFDAMLGTSKASGFKTKGLILDTEMFTEDIRFRAVASLSQSSFWHLETGNWRKNSEMMRTVRALWPVCKDFELYHYQVGNKNIDEVCSIIRRWYYSQVGRGNPAIIAYDYIKLTGENLGQNWAEHQAIGSKIDTLKKISEEIGCPILTAMQLNRSGENFNKKGADVTDDASAISLSDRMQWYASFVGIFRRKTLDEIALDGEEFGTHKLIPLKTRFQGRDAAGHIDRVKRPISKTKSVYENNYLNYNVCNFRVEEKGSLRDVVTRARERFELSDENPTDGTLI